MKGVAQDDLGTHLFQGAWRHPFDRAIRAHGHEDGGLDHAMVERESAAAGQAIGVEQVKFQHGEDCRRFKIMASP